jgi:hypothetical protein
MVPRLLATGSLVSSATAFRVGAGCLELLVERTPPLVTHALRASVGGAGSGRAQAAFRDDFLALARDSAEVSWRELRRGVDDLDAFTRNDEEPGERPHRPYRVKS